MERPTTWTKRQGRWDWRQRGHAASRYAARRRGILPRDENKGFTDPMQVRDLAAVTVIQLAGKTPSDYGLVPKLERDRSYVDFAFATDADRVRVIESLRADHHRSDRVHD